MITRQKQWPAQTQSRSESLAHVVETEGRLIVTQSSGPALRDLRNALLTGLGGVIPFLLLYSFLPSFYSFSGYTGTKGTAAPPPVGIFLFPALLFLWLLIRSLNGLFGKETFIFDKNQGVFIRNGFTVGPLREIRRLTVQVTRGMGQNPMFRIALELPRSEIVPIVTTHYVEGSGDFVLSRNGFGDPKKRFAVCEPWLNHEERNLIPFLPLEIIELREKMLQYVGEQAKC